MSFFADAYPRQIDVLTHISPFWRTYESNDSDDEHQFYSLDTIILAPYNTWPNPNIHATKGKIVINQLCSAV